METPAERQVLSHAATPETSNQDRFHVTCILDNMYTVYSMTLHDFYQFLSSL